MLLLGVYFLHIHVISDLNFMYLYLMKAAEYVPYVLRHAHFRQIRVVFFINSSLEWCTNFLQIIYFARIQFFSCFKIFVSIYYFSIYYFLFILLCQFYLRNRIYEMLCEFYSS